MKRRSLLAFLLVLVLFITACGNNTEKKPTEETKTEEGIDKEIEEKGESDEKAFQVAIDYMPENLYSSLGTDSITVITTPIYDPLFWDTKDGIEWRLAEDVEVSDDGLEYTVHLNKDANWSDGEPITTDDILFSIEFSAERDEGVSRYQTSSKNQEPIDIEKIDDKTIKFTLPIANNYFKVNLANMSVVPAHPFDGDPKVAVDSDYFSTPGMATSGAFEVEEVNVDSLIYTAREDYYRGKPNTDKIVMRVMGADANRKVAFESGELSYTRITNAQDLEKYESESEKYNITNFPEGRLNYIQINPYGPMMGDLSNDARRAIFMALDQQQIIDAVYGSNELAQKANTIIVPECYDHNPNNPFYENNIEEAKKLAEESGLSGQSLVYIYNKDRAGMEEVAVVVQQQLAQIGVNLQIEAKDSPTFFPQFFMSWDDNPEEQATWDLATNGWDSQRGERNYSYSYLSKPEKWGWSEEIAAIADKYDSEPDLDKRKEFSFEMQEMATEESWLYPLPYPNFVVVSHKNVTNLDTLPVAPEFGDYMSITVE